MFARTSQTKKMRKRSGKKSDERVSLSAIVQQAIKHSAVVAANLGGATPSTAKKAGSVSLPDESHGTTYWLHRDHERVCNNHHRAKENRAKENSPPPTDQNLSFTCRFHVDNTSIGVSARQEDSHVRSRKSSRPSDD